MPSFFSALDKIVKTGYKALQLEYFFTSGKDEVKAWTIQVGPTSDINKMIALNNL